jgi:hypothetical protein
VNSTHAPHAPQRTQRLKKHSRHIEDGYHAHIKEQPRPAPHKPGPPLAPDYICKRLCPLGQIWRGYGEWRPLSTNPLRDYWQKSRQRGQQQGCATPHRPPAAADP